ncbi:MAG TPA: Asp-tRNA(Asn)/Glu-tRNA(Gln) amidotransferase subunit GatC [Pseudomonadota bacterium]|nr:Asp-tRNA(Asn)/Glu-tRNA(Gln) amidotransferase subunit GatC [Pseudomonadota bacterium]HNK43511.1 Asp-tRNA(Asn)/Glu-tRNA(Gln) amidotransferase subunit GatC [Pseudomonadota bacterium]HNN53843.1 Asp-tRNA(Asn)/Glu-tRNA(Gln) amidotransferase subunit GatC [Pseudomonadota bacterium]HNO67558.1 Asp-tRNA(Asn)/Glu-tRNA(Gln) amidotransferase subunit GatC [Pseudomonadota bacterium]
MSSAMDRLISADEIRVTAEMANLTLPEQEIPKLVDELSAILGYAQSLLAVDVTGVPPMTHAVPSHCPLRGDVVLAHDSTDSAMRNAPAKEASYFAVPAVFAGGDDGFDAEG